jgi:hypothetical protein
MPGGRRERSGPRRRIGRCAVHTTMRAEVHPARLSRRVSVTAGLVTATAGSRCSSTTDFRSCGGCPVPTRPCRAHE